MWADSEPEQQYHYDMVSVPDIHQDVSVGPTLEFWNQLFTISLQEYKQGIQTYDNLESWKAHKR